MTSQSRISVSLCTYNGEKYLREQLQSIAAQTRLPDELVVCDDGSTDSTPKIVEEFARAAPFPVRFVRNAQNLGTTRNFEQAISLCTGDLIALCDQDDVWLPEKLARQAMRMDADPELGGIFSDAGLIDDNSRPLQKRLWEAVRFTLPDQELLKKGDGATVLERKTFVTGATLMVRAGLRPLFSPIPAEWVHDAWITWMLVLFSKLDFISDPLIGYRIHASQQIGVAGGAISQNPSLWKRLQRNRRDGPARRAGQMKELIVLERRLAETDNVRVREVLPGVRRKMKFIEDRRRAEGQRFSGALCVLCNPRNYKLYENGWKSMVRDLATIFLWRSDRA